MVGINIIFGCVKEYVKLAWEFICHCRSFLHARVGESKFQTGEELIDQLKLITKSHGNYIKHSQNSYKIASSMWIEDHISEHFDVYNFSWGSTERNKNLELIKNNLDQKI